jgi:hypothetical protein
VFEKSSRNVNSNSFSDQAQPSLVSPCGRRQNRLSSKTRPDSETSVQQHCGRGKPEKGREL